MAIFKKKKEELYKCVCCKGCTKQCLSNGKIARKDMALKYSSFMPCNNATELSIKEEALIPTKNSR